MFLNLMFLSGSFILHCNLIFTGEQHLSIFPNLTSIHFFPIFFYHLVSITEMYRRFAYYLYPLLVVLDIFLALVTFFIVYLKGHCITG